MTSQSTAASKSEDVDVQTRIGQLREGIAALSLELAQSETDQAKYRTREDPAKRISFAAEIFQAQQDKLRLRVEIELLEKKIRRLELGYAEDAVPAETDQHPLL
jgi:putative cell wall-binding protein